METSQPEPRRIVAFFVPFIGEFDDFSWPYDEPYIPFPEWPTVWVNGDFDVEAFGDFPITCPYNYKEYCGVSCEFCCPYVSGFK